MDWDVIDRMPCSITLLPVPKTSMSFYDLDDYERLVAAASAVDAGGRLRDVPFSRTAWPTFSRRLNPRLESVTTAGLMP